MITRELVELAFYAAWYPLPQSLSSCAFSLDVDLPADYLLTSNGHICARSSSEHGAALYHLDSSASPGYDIVLIASPVLDKSILRASALTVEVYYPTSAPEVSEGKMDLIQEVYSRLESFFGPHAGGGWVRLVYSPRTGWGYARLPLIVVSAEKELASMKEPFTHMARMHVDILHELTHFWVALADASTPDDWMNEGCTEYIAYRLSRAIFGHAYAERRLTRYLAHLGQVRSAEAIVETTGGSPDRELNHYTKPTLMFLEAERACGLDAMIAFFRALVAMARASQGRLTTEVFLEKAESTLGKAPRDLFHRRLTAKTWDSHDLRAALGV